MQEPLIQSSSTQYEEDFFINQWFLFSVAMVTLFIVFYIKIIKEDQQLSSSDAEITSYALEAWLLTEYAVNLRNFVITSFVFDFSLFFVESFFILV